MILHMRLSACVYTMISSSPVWGKKWHAPCEMLCSNKLSIMAVKFYGVDNTVTNMKWIWTS